MIKYLMLYDKSTRYITAFFTIVIASVLTYFFVASGGSYLPAWLTILFVAVALLAMLSVPRFVIVSQQSVEIHCVMELVRIKFSEIERIKRLERRDMKYCVPLFGIWGIFGYYGYYINLRKMRTFRLYSRKWDNFIMIEDRYDNRFIISAENPDQLIEEIAKRI